MLELNKWFFVLLINFLVLLYVLNIILFKPLLKVFKEREDTVKDSLSKAKEMTARKESAMEDIKKGLQEAGLKAKQLFESLRAEGLEKQKEVIGAGASEALKLTEDATIAIRKEAERARASLKADVERFSEEIVRKLLKV